MTAAARANQSSGKKPTSGKAASGASAPSNDGRNGPPARHFNRTFLVVATALATIAVAAAGLSLSVGLRWDAFQDATREPTFVGSQTCASCHRAQAALWHRSQHQRAMQHATEGFVLGNFDNSSFDYHGVLSRFFRKD